jgi:hypothetical protein
MTTITSGIESWSRDASSARARDSSAKRVDLPYRPFPKQQAFHSSPAKYRLFGGAAGPGKSKALLMEAILQAHEHPGANTLLLRRTFPELEQSLLLYFRRDIPRELYKSFHESKRVVEWLNGSTTRFGYCQSESDVYQYQSAEFLFIGIDELTLFTLRQWQFLTSRNRCPVPGAFPCMAGATNPGNIGHAWVKSLWIDKQPASGMENPDAYDPADYDFIPARVSDNPIYAADENYLKTLRALPSHLKRAFLDGDWDVFAGQYFDKFDPTRHVIRAEEIGRQGSQVDAEQGSRGPGEGRSGDQSNLGDWKPWWPRWISIDWGFEHPSAAYWHAAVPRGAATPGCAVPDSPIEDGQKTEEGTGKSACATNQVVTYREYVTHRTAPRDLAREIIARSLHADSAREKIDAIYLSPDAFAHRTDEASIADQMGDVFAAAGFPRPVPADDDRVGGWMLMYQMLDAGEWLLTDNCIELIRTLPTLVRDPARIEDIEKMDGDDPADAARYGLKSRYGAHRGPVSDRRMPLADRLSAHAYSPDPTIRAMQARKFLAEESRGTQPVSFRHRRR